MNRKILTCLILAATALIVAPGAADADSIAYVKDANVWIANPDGTGAYQVTGDGTPANPYGSPSQADDGTLAASHGNEIVRMRQNGDVLNSFDPPGSIDSAGQPIDGVPQDLALSPDGTRLVFAFYTYNCPPGVSCSARQVMRYATADGGNPGFGRLFIANPSWIGNAQVLAFGGYGHQVNFDAVDDGTEDDSHWFDDGDLFASPTDLGDGELSRDGSRLALVRGYGADAQLAFYAVSGPIAGSATALLQAACLSGKLAGVAAPSWSSDGRAVAFEQPEGVEFLSLPNVVPGDLPGGGRVEPGPARGESA